MSLAQGPGPGSGVVGADGILLFRFTDQCDGWTSEISSDLRIDYGEEGEVHTRWTFASWEAADGRSFRFRSREWEDGEDVPLLIEGTASLDAFGAGGRAVYAQPEEMTVDLPAGTMFPTHHLKAMIEAAQRGVRFLTGPLFDGASIDNPYTVSAVLRPLGAVSRRGMAAALDGVESPAWQVSLAFFAPMAFDRPPDFSLMARYRQDGVTERLVQDYGEFAIAVDIKQFSLLPNSPCGP